MITGPLLLRRGEEKRIGEKEGGREGECKDEEGGRRRGRGRGGVEE